jgi:hypothetical protein
MWQEIAMMDPTKPVDERYPFLGIDLELVKLLGINDVTQIAGNHVSRPSIPIERMKFSLSADVARKRIDPLIS